MSIILLSFFFQMGKDLLAVLSDSGKLSFLSFSNEMHRFLPLVFLFFPEEDLMSLSSYSFYCLLVKVLSHTTCSTF